MGIVMGELARTVRGCAYRDIVGGGGGCVCAGGERERWSKNVLNTIAMCQLELCLNMLTLTRWPLFDLLPVDGRAGWGGRAL